MKKSFVRVGLGMFLVARANADESMPAVTPAHGTTASAPATAGKLGVGIMAGEPTGGTVKFWLTDRLALDGAAGWSFRNDTDLYLHSDVLWHNFDLLPASPGRLPVYIGVGGLARFRDHHHDNEFGVRMPVGLDYMFESSPVDVFVEIAPAVDLAPAVRADITGGIGIRYWF